MLIRRFLHYIDALPQRWYVVCLMLLFLGVSIQYTDKALENRSAFLRWRDQIQQLEAENIYERYLYPNPPIMGLMLRPLTELPPVAGALVWFYLKVGMTLLTFWMVFRIVESAGRTIPVWAKLLTIALSIRPIIGDLTHGNVNLLILFLVVASLYAFTRGRDWLAGAAMALAIACKVTPLLFVPYFLWKRAWKALAGCAVGLVLFFWIVPGMFLDNNNELLASWFEQMVKPFVVSGKVFYSEHNNQSLPGLTTRLLTDSPSFSTYINDIYTPTDYHNLLSLSEATARWLVKGCMGIFALLIVWSCRTARDHAPGWRLLAEFSLIALGMLLFSERTWKHHCVLLLLPFATLCYYLAVCRPRRPLRYHLIGSLLLVTFLMASTSSGLLGKPFAKLAQVYGAYVWAFLLLSAALVTILRAPINRTPSARIQAPEPDALSQAA
ncbi:MAG: glycosyltransferase family 87 protein [Gemmataceae bacterium]